MEVEPARPVAFVLVSMDSLKLPGTHTTPSQRNLPVIQHATNLNTFRIINFD
jgi:hypothetical protein